MYGYISSREAKTLCFTSAQTSCSKHLLINVQCASLCIKTELNNNMSTSCASRVLNVTKVNVNQKRKAGSVRFACQNVRELTAVNSCKINNVKIDERRPCATEAIVLSLRCRRHTSTPASYRHPSSSRATIFSTAHRRRRDIRPCSGRNRLRPEDQRR